MKLRELTLKEMAATGGGASPGGPSGPGGPPSSPPSATVPTLASTARVGARPPGGGHGLSQQGDLAVGKGGIFLGHQQAQEPHNYDADAQVGQGLEWPKAAGASETTDVKRDEVEMPGEHHVAHHGDTHDGHGVSESTLREFAPSGSDDGDADPYRYPKPESYSRSADFFGRFEADHFDHEDFDDVTGVFKGYWDSTQIAYFKFDNPAKASGDDPGMGWYYEPDADITNDNTPAKPAVDNSAQRKQQELGMIDAFLKSGQTAKPGSQIHGLMKKHGMEEGSMNEFALPGGTNGDSGRWYTDDELADIIGDDWFQDFDVSHDEFNIDTHGEKAKQNLASYANSWFDDKGYNVNVMGVDHNEVDHNLKWYIVGSFHNPRFANEGMAEASLATMRDFFAGGNNNQSTNNKSQQRPIQKVFRSAEEYTQWAKQNKIVNAPRINEEPNFFSMPLRMSEYRGKHHPATNEPYDAKFKFSGDLKDRVHGLLDAGTKPTLLQVNPRHLLATQDWLSTQGGGKPPFATMKQHPVVLQKNNKLYILDGHHRSADALDSGTSIEVYLFRDEL